MFKLRKTIFELLETKFIEVLEGHRNERYFLNVKYDFGMRSFL